MSGKQPNERYSEQETAKRRDDALRRALSTAPTPHKPKSEAKPASKRKPKS